MQAKATNIGIKAIEIYFPKTYVNQEDLGIIIIISFLHLSKFIEKFDGVSSGKYTIGLGQKNMSFTNSFEDINSICLTGIY